MTEMPVPKVISNEDDGGTNELYWELALNGTKLVTVKNCSMPCLPPGPWTTANTLGLTVLSCLIKVD